MPRPTTQPPTPCTRQCLLALRQLADGQRIACLVQLRCATSTGRWEGSTRARRVGGLFQGLLAGGHGLSPCNAACRWRWLVHAVKASSLVAQRQTYVLFVDAPYGVGVRLCRGHASARAAWVRRREAGCTAADYARLAPENRVVDDAGGGAPAPRGIRNVGARPAPRRFARVAAARRRSPARRSGRHTTSDGSDRGRSAGTGKKPARKLRGRQSSAPASAHRWR